MQGTPRAFSVLRNFVYGAAYRMLATLKEETQLVVLEKSDFG